MPSVESNRLQEEINRQGRWPGQTFNTGTPRVSVPRDVTPIALEQVPDLAAGKPADSIGAAEQRRVREDIARTGTWPGQTFGR